MFVVGDTRKVLQHCQPAGFDPVKGYSRTERDLHDPRVREAVKEVAVLDGAFIDQRRRHRRESGPARRCPVCEPDALQGPRRPPLGRGRHQQGHRLAGDRRQPVERHRPPLSERRSDAPHRAAPAGDEVEGF